MAEGGDVLPKIRILGPEETSSTRPIAPDAEVENLINVLPTEITQRRIQKAFPQPDLLTHLGEQDREHEPVLVDATVLRQMTDHLRSNLSIELGGGIYGYWCVDPASGQRFTEVTGFAADRVGVARGASYVFNADSWSYMNRVVEQRNVGESIVGWVHSHPNNYPPIPSGYDQEIMEQLFNFPYQITLILGRGGSVDNKYALWRWENNGVRFQRGMNVVNGNRTQIQQAYRYLEAATGEAAQTEKEPVMKITQEDIEAAPPLPTSSEPQIKITEEDLS